MINYYYKILKKIFFSLCFLQFYSLVFSEIPRYINFQGKLTDSNGQVVTGLYDFQFKLFRLESGGIPECTETQTYIQVNNGLYSVLISSLPVNYIDFFNYPYWLEISVRPSNSVGSFETLWPRHRLTSVPYSFRAEYANNATPSSGTVMLIYIDESNGTDVNDTTDETVSKSYTLASNNYRYVIVETEVYLYDKKTSEESTLSVLINIGTNSKNFSYVFNTTNSGNSELSTTLKYSASLTTGGAINIKIKPGEKRTTLGGRALSIRIYGVI